MKYYVVGEVDITDQGWVPDYVRNVTEMVERRGGRTWLARQSLNGSKASEGLRRFW